MTGRQTQEVIHLRIVVLDPVPGVVLRLQSGRSDLVAPASASESAVTFDFTARVTLPQANGPMVFHGPFTHGPPGERFVYVNAGRQAGQAGIAWDRRAKVPLTGIPFDLVRRALATPGGVLEVRIGGRSRDGGPVCATVKLPSDAWRLSAGEAR